MVNYVVMSPPQGKWSSPNITGQPPPPCCSFSLTSVGERRAALFGGRQSGLAISDDLFIVELRKDTVVSVVNMTIIIRKVYVSTIKIWYYDKLARKMLIQDTLNHNSVQNS